MAKTFNQIVDELKKGWKEFYWKPWKRYIKAQKK